MSETDVESRIAALNELATLRSRATVLRHALGMENPLNSPSKEFCARIIDELGDGENPAVEDLTTMFKAAKLKADAAECLEVEEIGNSVGPVVSPAIARLEESRDAPIAEIAEEEHVDEDKFSEYEEVIMSDVFSER